MSVTVHHSDIYSHYCGICMYFMNLFIWLTKVEPNFRLIQLWKTFISHNNQIVILNENDQVVWNICEFNLNECFSHKGCRPKLYSLLFLWVWLTYCTKYSRHYTFVFFCFGCRVIAGPGFTICLWFHGSSPAVWWHACRHQDCSAERSLLPSSLFQPGTICQHRNDMQEGRRSLPVEAKRKKLLDVVPHFPKLDKMHEGHLCN